MYIPGQHAESQDEPQDTRRLHRKAHDHLKERGENASAWILLAIWWLWMPFLYAIAWGILKEPFPPTSLRGLNWGQGFDQWFMANFWDLSVFWWSWFTIGFIGSIPIWVYTRDKNWHKGITTAVTFILVAGLLGSITQTWRSFYDADKHLAQSFVSAQTYDGQQSLVFETPTINSQTGPDALQQLLSNMHQVNGQTCNAIGNSDLQPCIQVGTLPTTGWDERIGSLDGARNALKVSSVSFSNVSLKTQTITYLNTWKGQPPMWTGVMDGRGNYSHLGGVAQWTGSGRATGCKFKGRYAIDRSFDGAKANSLSHLLADYYPGLNWDINDVWGYCDGQQPIIGIPMTRMIYWFGRTSVTAGGFVTVQGDHGHVKLTYYANVHPGQFPGPVYPITLTATQREMSSWANGRVSHNNGFGFEPGNSPAQSGNNSEYLVRDHATGRFVYVTPLTLRNSSSQVFVAYSVSFADEVHNGHLNQMRIYVLANNDPRFVYINDLETKAIYWLSNNYPNFLNPGNKGKLVEFTPVDGDIWQVFGEVNNQVQFRLLVSASGKIQTQIQYVDINGTPTSGPPGSTGSGTGPGSGTGTGSGGSTAPNAICGKAFSKALKSIPTSQLAQCGEMISQEILRRTLQQQQ